MKNSISNFNKQNSKPAAFNRPMFSASNGDVIVSE